MIVLKILISVVTVLVGLFLLGVLMFYFSRIQMRAWITEFFNTINKLETPENGKEEK